MRFMVLAYDKEASPLFFVLLLCLFLRDWARVERISFFTLGAEIGVIRSFSYSFVTTLLGYFFFST